MVDDDDDDGNGHDDVDVDDDDQYSKKLIHIIFEQVINNIVAVINENTFKKFILFVRNICVISQIFSENQAFISLKFYSFYLFIIIKIIYNKNKW